MLASRSFKEIDQINFAKASGDFNPIHMDWQMARRTQAGSPIVHGIHSLLWLLDNLARDKPNLRNVKKLTARFPRMIYLNDEVEAQLLKVTESDIRARLLVDDMTVLTLHMHFESCDAEENVLLEETLPALDPPTKPMADADIRSGNLAFAAGSKDLVTMFPNAAQLIGTQRVMALGCSSCLVGMVSPGLHSIYGGISLRLDETNSRPNRLLFKIKKFDARFGLLQQFIQSAGLRGTIETFIRQPPVKQAPIQRVANQVQPGVFANSTALVIGGSRGLGEVTAKIIATGGGKTIITYATGKTEAEAVAHEINAWGGNCQIVSYNVREDAERQIEGLSEIPSHIYYFATPPIIARKAAFTKDHVDLFNDFYVRGFADLIKACRHRQPKGLCFFYPSSVFVEECPSGMEKYAAAKAAGEKLCAEINAQMSGIKVTMARLPRLPTDQTSAIQPLEMADAQTVLLPLITIIQKSGEEK